MQIKSMLKFNTTQNNGGATKIAPATTTTTTTTTETPVYWKLVTQVESFIVWNLLFLF
jgi:hypothetical protein